MCAGPTRRQGSGLLAEDHLVRELGLSIWTVKKQSEARYIKSGMTPKTYIPIMTLYPWLMRWLGSLAFAPPSVRYGNYSVVNIHARVMPSAWWVSPECQPCPPIPTSTQPGKKVDWTEVGRRCTSWGWVGRWWAGWSRGTVWVRTGIRREPSCGGNCKGDTPWVEARVQAGPQGALHGSENEFACITQMWSLLEVLVFILYHNFQIQRNLKSAGRLNRNEWSFQRDK